MQIRTWKWLSIVIYSLFFLSGFTGLLYEVLWIRLFGLIFGNTTRAISVVLASYMFGLAMGSWFFGKRSQYMSLPLRNYAILEFGVGAGALFLFLIRPGLEHFYRAVFVHVKWPMTYHVVQFITAFLVMFPATFLMGGTLPVISRAVIRDKNHLGLKLGKLYGINTFGALVGVFLTGFFLIRLLGVRSTILMAIIVNVLIGLFAYLAASRHQPLEQFSQNIKNISHRLNINTRIIIGVMTFSGLAAISYEVLWSRILVFVLTNSVYAFTVMLTTFLLGIALGAWFGGKWSDRKQKGFELLGWMEIAIGLSALFAGFVLTNLSSIHRVLFETSPLTTWWQWNGVRFLEAFFVMFFPTFFMGVAFPVAGRLIVNDLTGVGEGIGRLYFFNTLGGVAGSLFTGFVLIGLIGTSAAILVMVVVNISLGSFLLIRKDAKLKKKQLLGLVFMAVFLITVSVLTPRTFFTKPFSHVESDYPLIDTREGIEGTVTVHEAVRSNERIKRIDIDGLNVAGTSFMLRTLQLLQGHIPAFLHPGAKNVVQIGFGTGQTASTLLSHPIESYHCIEISRDVLELASLYFKEINQNVLTHPKFSHSIMDGKNFIKYTNDRFDIIMNDANYAVATGSASLFTKDHFEACRKKLKPGGFLSTWMTIDLDPRDFDIVLNTFQSVFPYCTLWMAPNCINKQVVLIGSETPWKIDFSAFVAGFDDPDIKMSLESVNISSPYDLLDCLILDGRGIQAIGDSAPVNTDNHPILEFSTRAIRSRDLCAYQNLGKILIHRPDLKALLNNLPHEEKARREIDRKLKAHNRASEKLLRGMLVAYEGRTFDALEILLEGSRTIPDSPLAVNFFQKTDIMSQQLQQEIARKPADPLPRLNLARHLMGLRRYDEAKIALQALRKEYPENGMVLYETARCMIGLGYKDSAEVVIRKSLNVNSKWAAAWYLLGEINRLNDRIDLAFEAYQKGSVLEPRMYEAYTKMGLIQFNRKKYDVAADYFKKSLHIMEYQPTVMTALADCYFMQSDIPNALHFYNQALILLPEDSELLFKTGNAQVLSGQNKKAIHSYMTALHFDSTRSEVYYNLGNIYVSQGDYVKSAHYFQKALDLNLREADYFNNLAMSLKKLGKIEQAISVFEDGIHHHPESQLLQRNYEAIKKIL